MKQYAVGGQVRDELLKRKIHDKDYVVVGSTIDEMLSLGFKQVGAEFPVFLHPETHDEYALARTERKTGDKHTDFAFDFNPSVSLEEDLARRDFTINALAKDLETNEVVDYFNGLQDLKDGVIRHINEDFKLDPLRVLRFCRFQAQLGFKGAEETVDLCKRMVLDGMINHLTEERIWKEIEKALNTPNFDKFIEALDEVNALQIILPELYELKSIPENPVWHPEGNSYAHTLLCLKQVGLRCKENPNISFINFGVMCHDLGKQLTPKDKLPSHHGHDDLGKEIVERLCARLKIPNVYRDFAKKACQYHMKYQTLLETSIKKQYDMVNEITKFKDAFDLELLHNVHLCDLFGKARQITDEEFQYALNAINQLNLVFIFMKDKGLEDLPPERQQMLAKFKGKKFGEIYRAEKISLLKHYLGQYKRGEINV